MGQLLESTGVLGAPFDWFNGIGLRNLGRPDYPLDRQGQLAWALEHGATPNGIAGLKLSPLRLDQMAGFDWASQWQPYVFVHLLREDRLSRAISDVIAQQTRSYRSTTPARAQPKYDEAQILNALASQAIDEERVRQYFTVNGITPIEITYEQLQADEHAVLNRIATALGVTLPVEWPRQQVELQIQRGEINRQWRERFIAE